MQLFLGHNFTFGKLYSLAIFVKIVDTQSNVHSHNVHIQLVYIRDKIKQDLKASINCPIIYVC